jgi:hypothetical protein
MLLLSVAVVIAFLRTLFAFQMQFKENRLIIPLVVVSFRYSRQGTRSLRKPTS